MAAAAQGCVRYRSSVVILSGEAGWEVVHQNARLQVCLSGGRGMEKPFPHRWILAASVSLHTGMSKLQPWPWEVQQQSFGADILVRRLP